jgi:hypothetical protein
MRAVAPAGSAGVAGNRGGDRTEFTMITVWDELTSIVAFAGPDPGQEWAVRG